MNIYIKPKAKMLTIGSMPILAGSIEVNEKETDQMLSKQNSIFGCENKE